MRDLQVPGKGITGNGVWLPLLVSLVGYYVLNKGYAYIGYLPIFTGEMTMIFYLVRLRHGKLLPAFFRTSAAKWWALFFAYNIFTFLRSAAHDPRDAIQNSIWWVYTIFFYFGFCFGGKILRDKNGPAFEKIILVTAYAAILTGLMAPAGKWLHSWSAFLYDGNSLFGVYSTYDASLSGLIGYLFYARRTRFHFIWIAMGLFVLAFLLESRAGMLEMMVILPYAIFVDRQIQITRRFKQMFIALILLVAAFTALNISYQGKHGTVSMQTVEDDAYSIFFQDDTSNLEGTKDDRLMWWANVLKRTCINVPTLFLGLGESVILNTAINGKGEVDRYPHNSFLSAFGFTGLIGLILFLGLFYLIGWRIFKASRRARGNLLLRWYPVFAIGYVVGACFSTVFEAPFHSFIFWTISGIIYHLAVRSFDPAELSPPLERPITEASLKRRG